MLWEEDAAIHVDRTVPLCGEVKGTIKVQSSPSLTTRVTQPKWGSCAIYHHPAALRSHRAAGEELANGSTRPRLNNGREKTIKLASSLVAWTKSS